MKRVAVVHEDGRVRRCQTNLRQRKEVSSQPKGFEALTPAQLPAIFSGSKPIHR